MLSSRSASVSRCSRVLARLALSLVIVFLAGCGDAFTLIIETPYPADTASSSASSGGGAESSTGTQGSGGSSGSTTSTGGAGGAGGSPLTHSILVVDSAKAPVAGIPLIVNDKTGAFLFSVTSDSLGQATLDIPEGGSVSALSSTGAHFEMISFLDPPPSAPITLGVAAPAPQASPPPVAVTKVKVTLALPPGATSWSCRNACNSNSGTAEFPVCTLSNSACSGEPTQDILLLAYNGPTLLGWNTALAIPADPGATLELTLPVGKPVAAVGVQITDIPGDYVSEGATITAAASDTLKLPYDQSGYAPSSSLALGFIVPAGVAGGYDITESSGALKATFLVASERRRHYTSAPSLVSFAANALARIYIHPLDLTEPARPQLTWTVTLGLRGDYGTVALGWHNGGVTFGFKAYFPSSHNGTIRFPEVPEVLGSFAPTDASKFALSSVAYEDVETIDGYAAALTSVCGGAPVQDGLGIVRSYAVNLPNL